MHFTKTYLLTLSSALAVSAAPNQSCIEIESQKSIHTSNVQFSGELQLDELTIGQGKH
jgi:hypothetical protein